MDAIRILDRLQQIIEAAKLLNSTLDPTEVTRILLRIVKEDLGVDRGTIFVLDREEKCLRSIVAMELDTEIVVPMGVGVAGTVAATGEIIDIADAYSDSRFAPSFDVVHKYQTHDIYCAPITNREGVIVGVFQLLNRQRPLTPEDREFLSGIAVHVGLALENAWFHQQLLEKQRIEEQLAVAERQMFHMEKLSLLGELVAGVTHELRNPLSTISGFSALLREQPDMPLHVLPYIDRIDSSVKRANAIVEKFLGFSRKNKFEKRSLSVDDLIRQTMDLRAYEWKGKHIRVVTDLSGPPAILGDPGQLQQVLMNLFKNAEDALCQDRGGTLTIRTSFNNSDKTVRLEVSDDGPGIPSEVQPHLFEPFFTTKSEAGTGLGLSICRRILDQHGGRIWFDTKPGCGTTFFIELPQSSENAVPAAPLMAGNIQSIPGQ